MKKGKRKGKKAKLDSHTHAAIPGSSLSSPGPEDGLVVWAPGPWPLNSRRRLSSPRRPPPDVPATARETQAAPPGELRLRFGPPSAPGSPPAGLSPSGKTARIFR